MTRDDIIRMAAQVESEITGHDYPHSDEFIKWCERFAALVVAAERERIIAKNAPEVEKINDHIRALAEAAATEREACAKVCEERIEINRYAYASAGFCALTACAAAIRARGQQ